MFDNDEKKFLHGTGGLFPPEKPAFTLHEDMLRTINSMRETIDRMMKFESRVENKVSDLMSKLTSDNVLFKETFNNAYTLFLQEVKNEINLFERNVDNTVKLFGDNVKTDYENLDTDLQGLIAENLKTYENKLNEFEETIFKSYKEKIESLIENNSTANAESSADFQRKITTELNMFEADVNTAIRGFTTSITENFDTFKTTWTKIVEARLDEQDTKILNAETYMKTNLEATVRTELGDMYDSGDFAEILEGEVFNNIQEKMEELETDVNTTMIETATNVEKRVETVEKRIDNIVATNDTATEGNAELLDIRVGSDGKTYTTAGESIRAQFNDLAEIVDNNFNGLYNTKLTQSINMSTNTPQVYRNYIPYNFSAGYTYRVKFRLEAFTEYEWANACFHIRTTGDASTSYIYDDVSGVFGKGEFVPGDYEWTFTATNNAKCLYVLFQCTPSTNLIYDITIEESINNDVMRYYSPIETPIINEKAEGKLSNIKENCVFFINKNENIWSDIPTPSSPISAEFKNYQYTTNYCIQEISDISNNNTWKRITNRVTGEIYRDWASINSLPPIKILALGDSICSGTRNQNKGFVGDLGLPYKNIGVSSATLSTVNASVTNIPQQLINETNYKPDVIIANGGINDYVRNAPLGEIPTAPAFTSTEAETLNKSTVTGGLGYLFFTMINKHPKAQRFFVIVHKIKRWDKTDEGYPYYPATQNEQGYTQQDLHDVIVKMCDLYNVKVIDVYKDSFINTAFKEYVSAVDYSTDNNVTYTDYVNIDCVHPLDLGYREGYIPLVKQALGLSTVNPN